MRAVASAAQVSEVSSIDGNIDMPLRADRNVVDGADRVGGRRWGAVPARSVLIDLGRRNFAARLRHFIEPDRVVFPPRSIVLDCNAIVAETIGVAAEQFFFEDVGRIAERLYDC
jgi:hypothetical protein